MAALTCPFSVPTGLCRQTNALGTRFQSAQPARHLQVAARPQRRRTTHLAISAHAARSASVQAVSVGNSFNKMLLREAAATELRFVELLDGRNKILVVSAVAAGSNAEKEGIKVGQQVLAVSDPVNESQLLSLKEKPSKLALVRAINNRRYPEVELSFTPSVASIAQRIIDGAGGKDITQALESNEVRQRDAQESTSPERNAQKAEFMAQQYESVSRGNEDKSGASKNKNQAAIIAGIGFFIIPLAFIAVAISSGYLQSLGGPGLQLQ